MARIVEPLSIAELEARYRADRGVIEARHYQAIWLMTQGRTFFEVAEVLALVPRWVERLAARYNASGPGARRRLAPSRTSTAGRLPTDAGLHHSVPAAP